MTLLFAPRVAAIAALTVTVDVSTLSFVSFYCMFLVWGVCWDVGGAIPTAGQPLPHALVEM